MDENKDFLSGGVFPAGAQPENNQTDKPETGSAPSVELNDISASDPAEPEVKPNSSEGSPANPEKPSANSAIIIVVIIILVALGIWYFNRGGDNPETDSGNENVNITVNDGQEQGDVNVIDRDSDVADSSKVKIIAYYNNTEKDPGMADCSRVHPLEREVEKKYDQMEINTVRGLLTGLSEAEKAEGWVSSIPDGTTLTNIQINGGTAIVNFGSAMSRASGSCAVTAIRSQVEQTMKQFGYVNTVVICINGNCQQDQILQP